MVHEEALNVEACTCTSRAVVNSVSVFKWIDREAGRSIPLIDSDNEFGADRKVSLMILGYVMREIVMLARIHFLYLFLLPFFILQYM